MNLWQQHLIILLIDGRCSITSSDQYLAKQVQKSGKPYILAINKIDELKDILHESQLQTYDKIEGKFDSVLKAIKEK